MGILAVSGAKCQCSFGSVPGSLTVTSQTGCLADGKPVATIKDMQPGMNLAAFGMCISLSNPAVAAATAAALGVLTPQPCTMIPAGTWLMAQSGILAKGIPCLTGQSTLLCGLGFGTIRIIDAGQSRIIC